MSKKPSGVDVKEVWDWRLSKAQPINYNSGDTWIVKIVANDGSGVLEEHDTGIPTKDKDGYRNTHDLKAVAACHEWARSVRDKYSRDNLELRKPVVALINAANRSINELANDGAENIHETIKKYNEEIKSAIENMHKQIVAGGAK